MIKGKCKTNLDDYDVSKVKVFAKVPEIGERIACEYRGEKSTLKVVQITHILTVQLIVIVPSGGQVILSVYQKPFELTSLLISTNILESL
jgi:hypothetical protein